MLHHRWLNIEAVVRAILGKLAQTISELWLDVSFHLIQYESTRVMPTKVSRTCVDRHTGCIQHYTLDCRKEPHFSVFLLASHPVNKIQYLTSETLQADGRPGESDLQARFSGSDIFNLRRSSVRICSNVDRNEYEVHSLFRSVFSA